MRLLIVAGIAALLSGGLVMSASAQAEMDEVFVSKHTSKVYANDAGGRVTVSEADGPTTFCVDQYTRGVTWRQNQECPASTYAVEVDWSGSFEVCRNVYSGELRARVGGNCPSGHVAAVI